MFLFRVEGLNRAVVLIACSAPLGFTTLAFAAITGLDTEFAASSVSYSIRDRASYNAHSPLFPVTLGLVTAPGAVVAILPSTDNTRDLKDTDPVLLRLAHFNVSFNHEMSRKL